MTVQELRVMLQALPEDFDDVPVHLVVAGRRAQVGAVVMIPPRSERWLGVTFELLDIYPPLPAPPDSLSEDLKRRMSS